MGELEFKLQGTVREHFKNQSSSDSNAVEIGVGDVVGVFNECWHKWVRAEVKEHAANDIFYVWLIDYGVPLVSNRSSIIKIPNNYTHMNTRTPRIFLGGLVNCVPAESVYDFNKDDITIVEIPNWSAKAIEIAQKAINCAVQLKFENSKDCKVLNRPHFFGKLKCQKPDGTWSDLDKCLGNAAVAKITTDNWSTRVHRLNSVRQEEWKAMDGTPLQANVVIERVKTELLHLTDGDNNQANAQPIECEQKATENKENDAKDKQPNDKKPNQKNSVDAKKSKNPMSQPNQRPIFDGMVPAHHRPGMFGQWRFQPRPYGPNCYSSYPPGWHNNGLNLTDRRYRKEVEFFEGAFRQPPGPVEPIDSTSSSSEDSAREPIKKKTKSGDGVKVEQNEAIVDSNAKKGETTPDKTEEKNKGNATPDSKQSNNEQK